MTLENTLNKIQIASKEVFNLDIPFEKINIYFEDMDNYKQSATSSAVFRMIENLDNKKVIGDLDSITRRLGDHRLRTDSNNNLAYDITVLVNNDQYRELGTLIHEIGHTIHNHYTPKKRKQKNTELKFAEILGQVSALYREQRDLNLELNSGIFDTNIGADILDSNNNGHNAKKTNNITYAIVANFDDEINKSILQLSKSNLQNALKKYQEYSQIIEDETSKPIRNQDYLNINTYIILQKHEAETIEENKKTIEKYEPLIQEQEKKVKIASRTITIDSKLDQLLKKLRKVTKQYNKNIKTNKLISEGWATYFAGKILENMAEKYADVAEYSNKFNEESLNRKDEYGTGYKIFAKGSITDALNLAGIKN